MNPNTDQRMWSTTPKRLSGFVGALRETGGPSVSVRELMQAFREHKFYPARDLPQFCVQELPDIFFSYHSVFNYVDIQEIVWNAVTFAANKLRLNQPGLEEEDLEKFIAEGIRIWVDFMFINQAARNLDEELEILPDLLQNATAHFVLGSQTLMRSWCCYEIALFNQHLVQDNQTELYGIKGYNLHSYIAPSRNFYIGWEKTETSKAEDKRFIEERIRSTFPKGFEGFNQIMAQANSIATLQIVEGSEFSIPSADSYLQKTVEKWYERWQSSTQEP